MSDVFAHVDGHRVTAVRLWVGNIGPWSADCDFEDAAELPDKVTLTIGSLKLSGTIARDQSGTFGLQLRCRIVAGGGGWASELAAKNYHNDAGVKALNVASDAAREAGETLGGFEPAAERLGVDYVRQLGPASRVLEDTLGGQPWWVDYGGTTQAGSRPATPVASGTYEVLSYDPRSRVAVLAVDDPGAVRIGSILTERLDAPQTVREIQLQVTDDKVRMTVWCGGNEASHSNLAQLLRSIAQRSTDHQLLGKYRYRVVRMSGDRVELQAVRKDAGLPDVMPVSMWPGVAGAHAELSPGAEVLCEFIEGDRTMPIITHFGGKDGVGHVPVSLTFCGSAQAAARQGDLVQSGGPGTTIIIGLVGTGAPPNQAVVAGVPYPVSFSLDPAAVGPLAAPLYGAISTGSPKVKL